MLRLAHVFTNMMTYLSCSPTPPRSGSGRPSKEGIQSFLTPLLGGVGGGFPIRHHHYETDHLEPKDKPISRQACQAEGMSAKNAKHPDPSGLCDFARKSVSVAEIVLIPLQLFARLYLCLSPRSDYSMKHASNPAPAAGARRQDAVDCPAASYSQLLLVIVTT